MNPPSNPYRNKNTPISASPQETPYPNKSDQLVIQEEVWQYTIWERTSRGLQKVKMLDLCEPCLLPLEQKYGDDIQLSMLWSVPRTCSHCGGLSSNQLLKGDS